MISIRTAIFHKSSSILIFSTTISFVLIVGISIIVDRMNDSVTDLADIKIITVIIAATLIALLLNCVDIINFYVNGKKAQIKVMYIVGIQKSKIYLFFFVQYNFLLILAYVLGIVIAIITSTIIHNIIEYSTNFCACIIVGLTIFVIENVIFVHQLKKNTSAIGVK